MKSILQKDLWSITSFLENQNFLFDKIKILNSLTIKDIEEAYSSISKWKSYSPTPLIELNKLSKELNLNKIKYNKYQYLFIIFILSFVGVVIILYYNYNYQVVFISYNIIIILYNAYS